MYHLVFKTRDVNCKQLKESLEYEACLVSVDSIAKILAIHRVKERGEGRGLLITCRVAKDRR
jgi:hypothetical protein